MEKDRKSAWPVLPELSEWEETLTTVHMWSQIVGKIKLAYAPPINHWWGIPLYVSPRGLTTSSIHLGEEIFTIDMDFRDHLLKVSVSDGSSHSFALEPMSVAEFYGRISGILGEIGAEPDILARPVEVVEATPFATDSAHCSYNPLHINLFWQALIRVDQVFNDFRARFIGKVSPVHFFWGAFDLAVTRFSGRTAPRHPGGVPNCADWVMWEAYSHEVSSAGFWAGPGLGEAAFYSYAYPEPDGFRAAKVHPRGAYFHEDLGEFILPYRAVVEADDPEGYLMDFLQTTYEAAADLASWDRKALER